MRQVWVFLMLCVAAATVSAQCAPKNSQALHDEPPKKAARAPLSDGPGAVRPAVKAEPLAESPAAASATPATMKVSVRQAAAPEPQAARGELEQPASGWSNALGGPLMVSAIVMLAIALRRGSR